MNDNLFIKTSLFESFSIIVTVIPWSNTPTLNPLRTVKIGVLQIGIRASVVENKVKT